MAIYLQMAGSAPLAGTARAVLRWDLAWALFLPAHVGDIPTDVFPREDIGDLTQWAWNELGKVAGRLNQERPPAVWCRVPPLTPAAAEYVVRLASFWDDDVYWAADDGTAQGDNLWCPPLVNVTGGPSGALGSRLTEDDGAVQYFYPQLGLGRLHALVETVEPGHASARLHAHSDVDEYYLIVSGRGTLRMGAHSVVVEAGSFIGKPSGPDLSSQILADQGEPVRVLDIEVWSDSRMGDKDVVHFPDFQELLFRGMGWGKGMVPDEALSSGREIGAHYAHGYRRHRDGTWSPREIPGAPARRRD
jgi:uncharacterized cupin superfamily protein